jgi:periplasmic glucans biosynthesis protein
MPHAGIVPPMSAFYFMRSASFRAADVLPRMLSSGSQRFLYGKSEDEDFDVCDDFDDFCADKSGIVEPRERAGNFVNVTIRRNRISRGHRIGLEHQPAPGSFQAGLRALVNGQQVSGIWLYRWTA